MNSSISMGERFVDAVGAFGTAQTVADFVNQEAVRNYGYDGKGILGRFSNVRLGVLGMALALGTANSIEVYKIQRSALQDRERELESCSGVRS